MMKLSKYLHIKNYINFVMNKIYDGCKISYSQAGEDILIELASKMLKINQPTYIDIGANDPKTKNNTYLFYKKGSSGVCIEPNPFIFNKIRQIRPRDICLNVGIGNEAKKEASYFMLTSGALNTFSEEDANDHVRSGNYGNQKIEKILKIPLENINDIISKYLGDQVDILSLDTEGFDLQILKSLNIDKYRPKIICAETSKYVNNEIEKNEDIISYVTSKNYKIFADTFINTIFIDKNIK